MSGPADTWQNFAGRLFATEDADPGYIALARVDANEAQKKRFMAAWVTYYHPGIAATASGLEGPNFWDYLDSQYDTAPRASERRHFRGKAGRAALETWRYQFPKPEAMVDLMRGDTFWDVRRNARGIPQIGPYFVWKFADVQERVFRVPCDFTGAASHSPKVPQEGARLISKTGTIEEIYARIVTELNLRLRKAPPWRDRSFTIQEAETVCCIYHQYIGGGYWPMSRTAKMIMRLAAYPCATSDAMIHVLAQGTRTQGISGAIKWANGIMLRQEGRHG